MAERVRSAISSLASSSTLTNGRCNSAFLGSLIRSEADPNPNSPQPIIYATAYGAGCSVNRYTSPVDTRFVVKRFTSYADRESNGAAHQSKRTIDLINLIERQLTETLKVHRHRRHGLSPFEC